MIEECSNLAEGTVISTDAKEILNFLNQLAETNILSLSTIEDPKFQEYEAALTRYHAAAQKSLSSEISLAIRPALISANSLAQLVNEERRGDEKFAVTWHEFHDRLQDAINVIKDEIELPLDPHSEEKHAP
jgi:hypothetical protein